jgi:hypothetical protein
MVRRAVLMANPFSIEPANPLQALMTGVQGYDRAAKSAKEADILAGRQEAMKVLQSGGDPRSALARLIGVGDVQGATAIGNITNAQAQQEWNRLYQGGMLDVARQNAGTQARVADKDQPQIVEVGTPDGRKQKVIVNPQRGTPTPIGHPIGDEVKLTATDRKAIHEAEDENVNLGSTIADLKRAKQLAPQAYSGYLARFRGSVGTNLPDWMVPDAVAAPQSAQATTELNQLLSLESVKQMSATLKGATTDRELFEFQRILSDPNSPPELKARTIDRMMTLAERKAATNQTRTDQMRGGTYYKPGGGTPAASQSPGAAPSPEKILTDAKAAIAAGAPRAAVIKFIKDSGYEVPPGL